MRSYETDFRVGDRWGFRVAGLVAMMLAISTPLHSQGSPWWAPALEVESGRFPVAFETQLLADSARPLPSGLPRPIQVSVWYPTPRPRGYEVMRYGDYVALMLTETTALDASTDAQRDVAGLKSLVSRGVPESVGPDLLAAEMLAVVGAMRAPFPQFPLVVIAQGAGQSVHEQAVLAEYLSSHGYVVASSPSPTRITGPTGAQPSVAGAAEEQADDLAFVIARVRTRRDVGVRHIGLVGYDAGSGGALALTMRSKDIDALVSLDGQVGTPTARASLGNAPSFNAPRTAARVLHVYQELDPTVTPDFEFLASLPLSELWLARTHDLRHVHFATLGPAASAFPEIRTATSGTRMTGTEYGNVLQLTLAFFDAFLKGDADPFRLVPALPVERLLKGGR